MVTPYPPGRDGIANYAVQEVRRLRAEGNDVEVLSPGPSAAHHHLDLTGPRGSLALAKRLRSYDRVIVQYHPAVFYPPDAGPGERAATNAALAAAVRIGGNVELRVHEFDYHARKRSPLERRTARAVWLGAESISVHTDTERRQFADAYELDLDRVRVTNHGASFERRTQVGRAEARARLDLPDESCVFLSIGFLQPHKGFDRAIRAFGALGAPGARLAVVGSVRLDDPAYLAHVEELRRLAAVTPGVDLREGYVGDEVFDAWIVAADALVLPYRLIWSSGVLERARLYDRPVIVSRAGGLEDQAHAGVVLVDDDAGLVAAMARVAGMHHPSDAVSSPPRPWPGPGATAAEVLVEVRSRAAAGRPGAPAGSAPPRSAPVRRLEPLSLPAPVSERPAASGMKRIVRRLTAWELEPVVAQVNHLRRALIEALDDDLTPPA